jgi:hypothetical protein
MGSGFESKPESKKANSLASGQRAASTLQRSFDLGAPAGLPLFLKTGPSSLDSDLSEAARQEMAVRPAADQCEREADQVAEQVVSMPEPGGVRSAVVSSIAGFQPAGAPPAVADVLRSSGQPLDGPTRGFLEPRFGRDFGDVRIHHDAMAADSAKALNARAYTVGNHVAFGPEEYAPSSEPGLRLLAHELAHVVQQGGGEAGSLTSGRALRAQPAPGATGNLIQRKERPAAPAEMDPQALLSRNAARLRAEALPQFQRGLDGMTPQAVEEAGTLALLLWSTVEGAYAALHPPDGPDLPEFSELRRDVLAGFAIQKFRGAVVAGPPKAIEHIGDVAQYVATQTRETVATVKAAEALLAVLGKRRLEYEDEEAAVRIFRERPNPWELGYLLAAVDQAGLSPALETFKYDNHDDLDAILASQKFTLQRGVIGPADRIGVLEPMPAEGRVRVLQPYGARELAVELYRDPSFYETVLVPYNRGVLGNLRPEALIPAGSELAVEPQLLWGRYRLAFMAAEITRSQFDRPYIEATPGGSAIAGTKVHYAIRWPVPAPPENALRLNTGIALWSPITSWFPSSELSWTVEDDPAKGRAEEWLDSRTVDMETLTKGEYGVDREWPETGTYTVRCLVRFGDSYAPTEIDLRYAQPVVTEQEKVEISWTTMKDPRRQDLHFSTAETYGEFQQIAQQLGVTEDELAADPKLAGPLGLGMSYYPEFLLRDLRKEREETGDDNLRKKLGWRIDALEDAIDRTKKLWGMRPIRALYVSSKNDRTEAAPLTLYVSPDPEGPRALPYALRLWDFTLEHPREYYYDAGWPATGAIHGMLQTFADDSPYPTGTVRFWLDPSVLPTEFLGDEAIPSEVLDLHTRGGPWIEKLAPTIVTLAAVVVGSALVGPEFALTAFAIYGAITGFADIVSRLAAGTFEFDLQTGLDILGIVGGLTAGISPILSVVRGVGEVAWLGTLAKTAGVLQLGVMAGTHLKQIVKAVQSGDQNEIMEAVMSAIVDGAFVVVTHAQSKAGQTEARARTVDDPVFASVQGGYLLDPGQMAPPAAAAPVEPAQPAAPPEPPPMAREQTPREAHEQWARGMSETGLSPRQIPAAPAGPAVESGRYQSARGELGFSTPEEAFKAYDEALARAGGREVGIYRNTASPHGEYAVVVGDEHSVKPPENGKWESALHSHPNPENVLTRRMPAPKDVGNTRTAAKEAGRPVTEFIDYPLPDGRRGLVAYTVEPSGRVTIKYERANGSSVTRTFENVRDYAGHYAERTTYVDPASPEYQWMMHDVADFYSPEPSSAESTATGVLKPDAVPEAKADENAPRDAAGETAVSPAPAAHPETPATPEQLVRQIEKLEQERAANDASAEVICKETERLVARRDRLLKEAADLRKAGFRGDNDDRVVQQRRSEHVEKLAAADKRAKKAGQDVEDRGRQVKQDQAKITDENEKIRRKIRALDEQLHPENYPKTTAEKGRIGEAKGHKLMMEILGCIFLGSSKKPRLAGINPREQGLDGVYQTPGGKYILAEMKYVGDPDADPSYGESAAGRQETKFWANANLDQAVGETMANTIRMAGFEYLELRYDPPPAGRGVTKSTLDVAGPGEMR